MSAKKETVSITAALQKIGCEVGDDKQRINEQIGLANRDTLVEVAPTLNLLIHDYTDNECFSDKKKEAFFELLNKEPPEVVDYVLRGLHSNNYWSIVTDATGLGYGRLVSGETLKGLKSAGNSTLHFFGQLASSGAGLFGGCMPVMPQIINTTSTPHAYPSKKLQ